YGRRRHRSAGSPAVAAGEWPLSQVPLARFARCWRLLLSMWGDLHASATHHMLSTARASSDMRLWSQGGSQTMLTLTAPTPATLATAFSTMIGSSCAEGQLGVVSVMSMVTARSSARSIL